MRVFTVRLLRGAVLWAVLLCTRLVALPDQPGEPLWQLTFTYNEHGLFLVRADKIPPVAKDVRTPGLGGARIKLEYDLDWQDAAGQTVLAVPVTIPLGGRVVLGGAPDEEPQPGCVMCEGGFVVRVAGPADRKDVTHVRLRKRINDAELTAPSPAPAEPLPPELVPPSAFAAEEQAFQLPSEPDNLMAPAPGPVSGTRIRDTGSDSNRLVIVVMGDGFTETNLASGSFSSKANSFMSAFLRTSPWSSYTNLANFYRVDIISNEQGADYEDAAPSAGGTLKDTYLGAAFWIGGSERCVYLSADGISKAYQAADQMVGVGVWDEIVVFVNSTKYGGCGGTIGVTSLNGSSDEIQLHEFGHSFANLEDEYAYGSSLTTCYPSIIRNVDCSNNFPHVKWEAWVTVGTPIPTPDSSQYDGVVGAFEGAAYQCCGVFRPTRNCRMRNLGVSYCPICQETFIMELFDRVRIVDAADPASSSTDIQTYGARTFSVTPVNVGGLSFRWRLNGALLADATNASVTLAASQLGSTNAELRLEATHLTPRVRATNLTQTHTWRIRTADTFPPELLHAVASNNTTRILVTFSEPVNSATAIQVTNYQAVPATGGAPLPILSATVVNGTNVILTTAAMTNGVNYLLAVSNVRDLAANTIPPSQIVVAREVVLIPPDNHTWRYFASNTNPPSSWTAPQFDDSPAPWASGLALFDAPGTSVRSFVGPNRVPVRTSLSLTNPAGSDARTLAYYFRTHFNLPGPAQGVRLHVHPFVDDGAVFYLNGDEVARLRMPAAPSLINYSTLATNQQSDSQNVFEGPINLPTQALLAGENVLAVEVHQGSTTSADLSFALQLEAEMPLVGFPTPELNYGSATNAVWLRWNRPDGILEVAPSVAGPWSEVLPTPESPYVLPTPSLPRFYRLRAPR